MDFVRDELEQRGPEERRTPRAGEPIRIRGDRRTVLQVDLTAGRVTTADEAGFAITRRIDDLWWDGQAWLSWQDVKA